MEILVELSTRLSISECKDIEWFLMYCVNQLSMMKETVRRSKTSLKMVDLKIIGFSKKVWCNGNL